MLSQIAIVAVVAGTLVSTSLAEPAIAPAVAVAAGAVGAAGIVGASAFAIHGATSLDKQRHAKMEFLVPNGHTEWTCGSSVNVKFNTFGFGSFWGISNSKFTLVDSNGNAVEEIVRERLAQSVQEERTAAIGRARNGRGEISWNIPDTLPSGSYMIEFESHNAMNMDRSRHRFVSAPFKIHCGGDAGNQTFQAKTQ
ncbi:hypothetical protein BKA69DRAFT_1170851 [Paraphysoderma sedebokerense]|nr:hypothetical protein BKA69DRAFT_1170851 [Paraphysoderma sedebokerense]